MARRKSPTLTEAELKLMDSIWQKDQATVTEVVAAQPKSAKLAYSTVLTPCVSSNDRVSCGTRRRAALLSTSRWSIAGARAKTPCNT